MDTEMLALGKYTTTRYVKYGCNMLDTRMLAAKADLEYHQKQPPLPDHT